MRITDTAVQAALEYYSEGGCMGLDSYERKEATTAMLEAALPYLQIGFEVKKLEWVNDTANTSFGDYDVYRDEDEAMASYPVCASSPDELIGHFPDETEAKAAAKADFERRVRECIVAKPVDVAPLDANYILYPINHLPSDSNGKCGWTDIANAIDESYRRIRTLSAEPAQGEQWQPIETAPKDELVIVYTPPKTGDDTCRIDFDYIDTGIAEGYWFNHGEAREHFECVGKPDCWSGGIPSEAPYTHWMPLPSAPTKEVK